MFIYQHKGRVMRFEVEADRFVTFRDGLPSGGMRTEASDRWEHALFIDPPKNTTSSAWLVPGTYTGD